MGEIKIQQACLWYLVSAEVETIHEGLKSGQRVLLHSILLFHPYGAAAVFVPLVTHNLVLQSPIRTNTNQASTYIIYIKMSTYSVSFIL